MTRPINAMAAAIGPLDFGTIEMSYGTQATEC